MSRIELEAKLKRLSQFTNPPAEVIAEALEAYAAHVSELEEVIAKKDVRIGEEVSFQRFIRKSEQETRRDLTRRHTTEKRRLIQELGFAAIIRDRVMNARWQGRKTIKVDALLEGLPVDEMAI